MTTTTTLFPQFFRVAEKKKFNPLPRLSKSLSCQGLWGLACACLKQWVSAAPRLFLMQDAPPVSTANKTQAWTMLPPSPLSSLLFPRKLASRHIASPASGSFLSLLRVRLIHKKQARDGRSAVPVTLGATETTTPVSPRGRLAPPASRSARGGGAGLSSAERARARRVAAVLSDGRAGVGSSFSRVQLLCPCQRRSLTQREDGGPRVRRLMLRLRSGEPSGRDRGRGAARAPVGDARAGDRPARTR